MDNLSQRREREQSLEEQKKEEALETELSGEKGEEAQEEPWALIKAEAQKSLIEKHEPVAVLSETTRNLADQLIGNRIDETNLGFARDWFSTNKESLKDKGYMAPDSPSDGYILKVASEMDAFEQLETEKQWSDYAQKTENLYAARTSLRNGAKTTESRFLLLNLLNREDEQLLKKSEAAKSELEKETLNSQTEELYNARREVYQGISGKDLEQTVSGSDRLLMAKEEYASQGLEQLMARFRAQTDSQAKWEMACQFLGYNIEEKTFLKLPLIELTDKEGKVIGSFPVSLKKKKMFGLMTLVRNNKRPPQVVTTRNEQRTSSSLDAFLEKELPAKAKNKYEKDWQRANDELRQKSELELKKCGDSPEDAIGGIEAVYGRVKEKLVRDFIKEQVKKEPKTRDQLLAIAEKFKGKGLRVSDFFDEAVNQKGKLEGITGRWENDKQSVTEFLSDYGIKLPDGATLADRADNRRAYEKKAKTKRGLLEWLLDFIFNADKEKEAGKNKKKLPSRRPTGTARPRLNEPVRRARPSPNKPATAA